MLFIADLVDGVSSCMSSVCSAYVVVQRTFGLFAAEAAKFF